MNKEFLRRLKILKSAYPKIPEIPYKDLLNKEFKKGKKVIEVSREVYNELINYYVKYITPSSENILFQDIYYRGTLIENDN